MRKRDKYRELYENLHFESFINSPNVKAFIGPNYDYFKNTWTRDLEKKKGKVLKIGVTSHLNWVAMLFTPVCWYFYRKMYGMAWMLTGIYGAFLLYMFYTHEQIGSIMVGVNVGLGMMTVGQYFFHVVNFMEKNSNLPQAKLEEKIAKAGGASWPVAIGGSLLAFAALVVCAAVGTELFGPLPEPGAPLAEEATP